MTLLGVAREAVLDFKLPRKPAFSPTATGLPGRRGLEVDLPISVEQAEGYLRSLPEELEYNLLPLEDGVRIRMVHGAAELRWSSRLNRRTYRIRIGPESEETRLRKLAARVQQAIPVPAKLGPLLELWEDAERATSRGDLALARRLWEKLAEHPEHRDLARLRLAELFVISGHVNEALERLRSVSRDHPRSTGAALARLTALHLEAVTEDKSPKIGQVVLAATSGDRSFYEAFTWMRSTEVFILLDAADRALHRFPATESFPSMLQGNARIEHNRLISAAIGVPALFGNDIETIVQFEAWEGDMDGHPQKDQLEQEAASAYLRVGLARPSIKLLRAALSRRPTSYQEARVIGQLIEAYVQLDEVNHAQEVMSFQLENHPRAPGLDAQLRDFGVAVRRTAGVDEALIRLDTMLKLASTTPLQKAILSTSVELASAWGSPAQAVRALERLQTLGFDDEGTHAPALALGLSRIGRRGEAIPMLRAWIARSTDAELRDEMGYVLAMAEIEDGNRRDGEKILRTLAIHSTHWGRVARARLRERGLEQIVLGLESQNGVTLKGKEADG
jgi:tetratricopeptide (TPR) repeat protein